MSRGNDQELINTKQKLRLLEESYEEARTDPEEDEHLREVEMESLKRLINQLKEEIARYEAHLPARAAVELTNDIELANTRAKLALLESRYETVGSDAAADTHVREVTLRSLKRYINQFKEEIARYEAHQPARR